MMVFLVDTVGHGGAVGHCELGPSGFVAGFVLGGRTMVRGGQVLTLYLGAEAATWGRRFLGFAGRDVA